MHTDSGPIGQIYLGVVAYSATKWNAVPATLHSVAYEPTGFIAYAFKVIGLISHGVCPIPREPTWLLAKLAALYANLALL